MTESQNCATKQIYISTKGEPALMYGNPNPNQSPFVHGIISKRFRDTHDPVNCGLTEYTELKPCHAHHAFSNTSHEHN